MAVTSLHLKAILCKYDCSLSYNIFVTYFVQGIPLSEIGDDGLPFTHKNGSHSQLELKAFLDLLSVMRKSAARSRSLAKKVCRTGRRKPPR